MSIVTSLLDRLGLIRTLGTHLTFPLRQTHASKIHMPHVTIDRGRAWNSDRAGRQFNTQRNAARAFEEAYARLPVAR